MLEFRRQKQKTEAKDDIILNGTKIGEIWLYKDSKNQYMIDGYEKTDITSPNIHGICDEGEDWITSAIKKANSIIADMERAIKMLEGAK